MGKILKFQTSQTTIIKKLTEALNGLLGEACINFYPNTYTYVNADGETIETEGGLVIRELNKQDTVLIHSKLLASKFDKYEYLSSKKYITIGVGLQNLLKILKIGGNYDVMTWKLDDDNMNELEIIFNKKSEETKTFRLNLMDLDTTNLIIETEEYSRIIEMPSKSFQEYCKNMSSLTNKVELISTKSKLIFRGRNDCGTSEFAIDSSKGGMAVQSETDEILQGRFDLKYLTLFTKCTDLCTNVVIYIQNDKPLIIEYAVGPFGKIIFVLSPSTSS